MASLHRIGLDWIMGGAGWFSVWCVECIDAVVWAFCQRQTSSGGRVTADHRSITIAAPRTKKWLFYQQLNLPDLLQMTEPATLRDILFCWPALIITVNSGSF